MKKSRVWQPIVPGTQNKPQDTLQIRKTPWHGVTKQPPALNRMKKSRVWQAIVPGTQTKPQDALQIRKTPSHGVTKQPPALNRMKKSRVWQAIVPGTQTKPQDTLQIRKTPWHGVTKQPPALNRMKKSRVWQVPQNKPQESNQENTLARRNETASCKTLPQDTLQIRKTPWHGVTKQPPAVPLPGPNVTPEPNEKIKGLAGNCSRHTKQATRHPSNQENTWHGVTKQPPAVPLPGPNVTPEPNEKIESRVWQAIVPGTQNKPQDTLQIRKTPWHGVTKQPPAVPLPGPNVTPEPNEKIKDLAGNCSRHTK